MLSSLGEGGGLLSYVIYIGVCGAKHIVFDLFWSGSLKMGMESRNQV